MFVETVAPSWDDVVECLGRKAMWAFRGQANAAWTLETTLYREARRQQAASDTVLDQRESWLLYQFERYAHQHHSDLPDKEDVLGWLTLIQHYGGPTRLLDFTYSLYVSAFFSVETSESDSAIWATNLSVLTAATEEKLGFRTNGRIDENRRRHNAQFNAMASTPDTERAVIHVEPDRMHERLWAQQGLFLAPTNPNKPFIENYSHTFPESPEGGFPLVPIKWDKNMFMRMSLGAGHEHRINLMKIVLPRSEHRLIKRDLRSTNINAATLFPGLEGFARSLKFHI